MLGVRFDVFVLRDCCLLRCVLVCGLVCLFEFDVGCICLFVCYLDVLLVSVVVN